MKRWNQGTRAAGQGNALPSPISLKSALGNLTLCPINTDGPGQNILSPAHMLPLCGIWSGQVGGGYEDTILQIAEQIDKDRVLPHHVTSDKSQEPEFFNQKKPTDNSANLPPDFASSAGPCLTCLTLSAGWL